MGSSLSQLLCCVLCQRCREQQAAHAEPSETKPVLQSPGDTQPFCDTQPPTPALKIPQQGSKDLGQDRQPSADALEDSGEPGSAAGGWEAAWNPMDFFVAPTDEEVEGEVEDSAQQKAGETEEEVEAVADAPEGAELVAEEEQPGTGGAPGAGVTLQEGNSLSLIELWSEDEPGQGCDTGPAAHTRGVLLGWDLSLCAVQVPGQGCDRDKAAETNPLSSISFLVEAMSGLTLQSPTEVTARAGDELYSTSAVFWKPLCPQWGSLQLLEQESLGCAGLAGLSGTLQQLQDGALGDLGQEGSRGCTPGPEAEHGVVQAAVELPEPAPSVPAPVKQEAEPPHVPPTLPEVLGSSRETEADNVEA